MVTSAIQGDDVSLAAHTLLFVRLSADALSIISTEGGLTVTCSNPSFAIRDLIGNCQGPFLTGSNHGRFPLGYTVTGTAFSSRTRRPAGAPLPDSVPVRHGWFLLETGETRDYHPWQSLQIVGVTSAHRLVVGFASVCYELLLEDAAETKRVFRLIADDPSRCHCTVFPPEAYLNWLPTERTVCTHIREIPHLPPLGADQLVKDFSRDPAHASFKAKMPPRPEPRGHDI